MRSLRSHLKIISVFFLLLLSSVNKAIKSPILNGKKCVTKRLKILMNVKIDKLITPEIILLLMLLELQTRT